MKRKPIEIRNRSRIRNKLSRLTLQIHKKLENLGGRDFEQTGEANVMRQFVGANFDNRVIVFDVGASAGHWSAKLKEEIGRLQEGYSMPLELHSFEPIPGLQNEAMQVAVSDQTGTIKMYKFRSVHQSSVYERRPYHAKGGVPEVIEVSSIRLDAYIKGHHIPHIDFLKIDTEGHERAVLEGLGEYLRPDFVPLIQFEYGPTYADAGNYLSDMYALLKDYRVCKLFPKHLEETPYHGDREDFQFTNYLAVAKY